MGIHKYNQQKKKLEKNFLTFLIKLWSTITKLSIPKFQLAKNGTNTMYLVYKLDQLPKGDRAKNLVCQTVRFQLKNLTDEITDVEEIVKRPLECENGEWEKWRI